MATSKQLNIEMRTQRRLLSKTNCLEFEDFYTRDALFVTKAVRICGIEVGIEIVVQKLKISKLGMQYLLQRQLETGINVDRKISGAPKVTIAAEDKHSNIENKRQMKTRPELTAGFNFSRLQSTLKNRHRSIEVHSHQESPFTGSG